MKKSIKKEDNDTRVDKWLLKNNHVSSMVEAQKLMRKGRIRVNSSRVKIGARLNTGDEIYFPEIEVQQKAPLRDKYSPTEKDKNQLLNMVIYKDDNVIVINKPAGLAVQGGSGSFRNLDSMLEVLKFGKPNAPKLVHRLDKNTSGILLLARDNNTAKIFLNYFKEHKVQKIYKAWVVGVPTKSQSTINAPLRKKQGNNEKVIVTPSGKEAITDYKVVKTYKNLASLLEIELHTGRTHQIRVHMNHIGHPIVGDGKYGSKNAYIKDFSDNMHLHAERISFPDVNNEEKIIKVIAPMPDYFNK